MKVYSLDTYRALLNEGREAEANDKKHYLLTSQADLDIHFDNIERVKKDKLNNESFLMTQE